MTVRLFAPALLFAAALGLGACGDSAGDRQQAHGEIKESVGSVVESEELKREGQTDQVVGGVKDAASEVGDAVKDATN